MSRILIVGATSAIAGAAARLWAQQGSSLLLAGRDMDKLELLAADLRLRGAPEVQCQHYEATMDAVAFIEQCWQLHPADVVLIAHGSLPDQHACELDPLLAKREWHTNAGSVMELMAALANKLEARGSGTLAVISSVAGDRGRQSNYHYGAAKGAVTLFAQGLRNRLYKTGVKVLTIKPGFVDTPMTAELPKGALWAQPEAVAAGIVEAVAKGRDDVYLPGFWRWVMLLIRCVPEVIFKRLSL